MSSVAATTSSMMAVGFTDDCSIVVKAISRRSRPMTAAADEA